MYLTVSKEMYLELKERLKKVGVIVQYSACEINGDKTTYDIYFINNYQRIFDMSASEEQKEWLEEFNKGL